jgi:arylsulfatase A-like enzyme
MNVLVLALNHCHLGYLGCYGNQWIQTPALDRLAAESLVFDQHFIENVETPGSHHAWWTGRHSFFLPSSQKAAPRGMLPERLSAAGVRTGMISDAAPLFRTPSLLRGFVDVVDLTRTPMATGHAPQLEPLIASAIEWLDRQAKSEPFLLWLETDILRPPWEPPEPFASIYAEPDLEDDPECDDDDLPGEPDDQEIARYAYAAQVSYVDACAGELFDHLRNREYDTTTAVILLSNRGMSLGEHGDHGCERPSLYEELVHVPLLLRVPDGRGAATRSAALVQPVDLAPTLLDLFGVASADPMHGSSLLPLLDRAAATVRDFAVTAIPGHAWSLRTSHWHLITPTKPGLAVSVPHNLPLTETPHPASELYLKPEDRWDQHNVAALYPDEVERLTGMLEQRVHAIAQDRIDDLASLPATKPAPHHGTDQA